ncbi:MAG: hypothetical protein LBV42_00545 [Methanobrevibacter sp.]|jgi:hypothetical protein|nr:hypothetical protein [Methanobrevibacter sp.]
MSDKIKKLIKGVILLILGLFLIVVSIKLYLENIFIYIGFIVFGFGACDIFINLFGDYTKEKLKSFNTPTKQYQESVKKDQNPKNEALNNSISDNEKLSEIYLSKVDLKPNKNKKKHSSTNSKLNAILKFKKSIDSNVPESKTKNNQIALLKSADFPDSNFNKSKSIKKDSSQYVFTPNYQKPSKIIRKPIKKFSKAVKSSKIKPNLSINQLSKILGIETKEEELLRLKRFLAEENNLQKENIDDIGDMDFNLNGLDIDLSNSDSDSPDLDINNLIDDLNVENNIQSNDSLDELNNNFSEGNNSLEDENHTKSYFTNFDEIQVLYGDRTLNISKSLEKLVNEGKKEIVIAVPSLNFLSNNLIPQLNNLNSKIIMEKSNTNDISHSLIISSLSKDLSLIRTTELLENIIVVVDNTHALLVSKPINSAIGVGAVFTKKDEIEPVKHTFDLLWDVSEKINGRL